MVTSRLSQDIFEILYKSNVGIAICDNEGRFIWGNPQYQKISNFDVHKVTGQHILDIMTAHSVNVHGAENMFSVVLQKRASHTCLVDFQTGHEIIATATPLFNKDGSLRWLMYSLVDCNQVFDMQQKLAEVAERMEITEQQLQQSLLENHSTENYVVHDQKMIDIYASAIRMAKVPATVLILGETGTGKDHLARFIHNSSDRKDKPFVHVNCSAIPENLFESELFGYEAGSFTGASKKGKMGLIEFANNGTLYLDEVAEIPLNLQTKLLVVLQDRCLNRIGSVTPKDVDVRVIAATNRNLSDLIKRKEFREDLFYRLNVLEIHLPRLNDRKDDIIPLIHFFINKFNKKYKLNKQIHRNALRLLVQYDWPGNVRELEHIIERMIIMCPDNIITENQIPFRLQKEDKFQQTLNEGQTLKMVLESVEEQIIRNVIAKSANLKDAAEKLGIELSTLTKKKQKYQIYQKKEY